MRIVKLVRIVRFVELVTLVRIVKFVRLVIFGILVIFVKPVILVKFVRFVIFVRNLSLVPLTPAANCLDFHPFLSFILLLTSLYRICSWFRGSFQLSNFESFYCGNECHLISWKIFSDPALAMYATLIKESAKFSNETSCNKRRKEYVEHKRTKSCSWRLSSNSTSHLEDFAPPPPRSF